MHVGIQITVIDGIGIQRSPECSLWGVYKWRRIEWHHSEFTDSALVDPRNCRTVDLRGRIEQYLPAVHVRRPDKYRPFFAKLISTRTILAMIAILYPQLGDFLKFSDPIFLPLTSHIPPPPSSSALL
ncbi:MAG: hypothetical protein EF813_06135 [Methanosarcinales archaeon]|nr:MAG: hypothetical protein EF813_06135 [Methanosarcinales archaeon]